MDTPALTVVIPARAEPNIDSVLMDVSREIRLCYPDIVGIREAIMVVTVEHDRVTHCSLDAARELGVEFEHFTIAPGASKWDAILTASEMVCTTWVVLCDGDVRIVPGSFQWLRSYEDTRVGAIAARVIYERGTTSKVLMAWVMLAELAWHQVRRDEPGNRWALPGPFYMVRRRLLPQRLPSELVDDASIGLAVRASGYAIAYCDSAVALHPAPDGLLSWWKQKVRTHRGWLYLSRQYPRDVEALWERLRRSIKMVDAPLWAKVSVLMQDQLVWLVARWLDAALGARKAQWKRVTPAVSAVSRRSGGR